MTFLVAVALLASPLAGPLADEGRGVAAPDAKLTQLVAGRLVYGEPFDAAEHYGEVVLVVFGGS